MKIREDLHPLFSTTVLCNIIGDYILGSPLLNLDIFSRSSITTYELCALLYSIACCHECTVEVLSILNRRGEVAVKETSEKSSQGFDIWRIPFIYPIMCRYYYMKNERSYNHMLPLVGADDMKLITNYGTWHSPPGNADLYLIDYNYTRSTIPASQGPPHESIVAQIAHLLSSCGITILKCRELRRYNIAGIHPSTIITAISFSKIYGDFIDVGKALRLVRRRYGPHIYYNNLRLVTRYVQMDLLRYLSEGDGETLEDMIMISLHTYGNVCAGDTDMASNVFLQYLFKLPSLILSKYCEMIEKKRNEDSLVCVVLYKGITYHVSMEAKRWERMIMPVYVYDSGKYICYKSLLQIITYHFVWTYDREYILNHIGKGLLTEHIESSEDIDPILRLLVSVDGT